MSVGIRKKGHTSPVRDTDFTKWERSEYSLHNVRRGPSERINAPGYKNKI